MAKTKIIIDCDPGCDDTIALIAFLTSPLFDVVGITSIGGNVDPAKTQANALGVAAMVGRKDVPVYSGADKPLKKKPVLADDVHGESGVAGLVLPADRAAARTDKDAADFILSETRKHPGDITLVVIGPMTNIAIALQRDPSLPQRVKRLVTMGGAYGDPGGNMSPSAEFNIFCDPHAAAHVYDAGFSSILVYPLDATHKAWQGQSFRDWMAAHGAKGENVAAMLHEYAVTYPGITDKRSPLHDFHTFAGLVAPDLHIYKQGRVHVVTEGAEEGRTILTPDESGPVRVAVNLDERRFFDVLKSALKDFLA